MKNYKGVYFTKCSLVILLFIFNACDIQKRRYNKGFYMNNGAHPKTFVNHKTDLLLKSKGSINTTNFSEELSMSTDTESVEIIDSVLVAHDKINYIEKKQLNFTPDTITKKQEKNDIQKNSKVVKPKMELFSKLALIAILINIAIVVAIPLLVIFFSIPNAVIVLILLSLFAPAVPLLLATEGKFKVSKNPEKYRWPNLTGIISIVAVWMFAISLFYLLIFVFVAGVSTAGW